MAYYRLYFLDEQNHIKDHAVLACDTDHEAWAEAEALADGSAMELWNGARVVHKLARQLMLWPRPDEALWSALLRT